MRHSLLHRHANGLAVTVLAAFAALVLLAVAVPALIAGGLLGWGGGLALAVLTAQTLARPCGRLMGRIVR